MWSKTAPCEIVNRMDGRQDRGEIMGSGVSERWRKTEGQRLPWPPLPSVSLGQGFHGRSPSFSGFFILTSPQSLHELPLPPFFGALDSFHINAFIPEP